MKHNIKITLVLLAMFIITQFIGLYVVNYYQSPENKLPFGMESPEVEQETDFYSTFLPSLIIAFIIAISFLFFLTKFNAEFILKLWFFIVVIIALGITLSIITNKLGFEHWIFGYGGTPLYATFIASFFAFIKIYQRNFLIHNLTELLIYPGIAAVFVPILNFWTIVIFLILISIYDMWAVWHSGIMQKMAKYQMDTLKIFSGFFVPYFSKKVKMQIKKIKSLPKESREKLKNKNIKVNVALLGGGDVVFPIITAGVMLKTFGFVSWSGIQIPIASILVILGATLGLGFLFFFAEKKKFYPAMPFITAGIFIGMVINYLLRFF